MTPDKTPATLSAIRDQAPVIADEEVDFADEWDDEESSAYHDRVEAGLEPEDSDG